VPPEKQRLIKMKLGIADSEDVVTEAAVAPVKRDESNKSSQKSEKKKVEKVAAKAAETDKVVDEGRVADNGMRVDLDSPGEQSDDEDTEISESEDETANNDVGEYKFYYLVSFGGFLYKFFGCF